MSEEMQGRDIFNVLLKNYISYDRMFPMALKVLYGDRDRFGEINFFIDLNSFLKPIWVPPKYSFKNRNVLTSSIINACAHYRAYFWSRHHIKTNIYLVWGYNTPTHLPVEYNAHFRERVATNEQAHELLKYNLDLLETLCPYLPQIYFIDGGEHEVAGVIYELAKDMVAPTIILSSDAYTYQLVAECPTMFVFNPAKKRINTGSFPEGGAMADLSWVVTKENLFKAVKHKLVYAKTAVQPLAPSHLIYCLALAGLRSRHIKGDMSFNRACAVISDIEAEAPSQLTSLDTLAYSLIYNPIDQCRGIGIKDSTKVVERGNMLFVGYAAKAYRESVYYPRLQASLADLYDPNGVREIAAKEYNEYPLNIDDL